MAAREPEVFRGTDSLGRPLPSVRLTFRGLSESRTASDRDTRVRIMIPAVQAAQLWRLLGEVLSEAEVAGWGGVLCSIAVHQD